MSIPLLGDLGILTPTRFRLENARRLADAVFATATRRTYLILAIDEDDTSYDGATFPGHVIIVRGPRQTCGQWTNALAETYAPQFTALASFGDDHAPKTPGWDARLLAALQAMGGHGIVYGNDMIQGQNLATAPVMSSSVVAALGWMFLPAIANGGHFFADNVWMDLARPDLLRYVPDVIIRHYHYAFDSAVPRDQIYAEAEPLYARDEAVYHAWQRKEMEADRRKLREYR